MTDRSKFEQMLEHLINEDQDKAKELFHQLVVEKSREIYETILAEDFADLEEADGDDEDDEEKVDEAKDKDEDEEKVEENFGFVEGDDEDEGGDIGGDATDDFIDDVDAEGEDEGGEEGGEDLEDRVVDLEDALDDLRAEFEALMSDEAGEEEHSDMDFGGDDMGDDEMKDSFDPNLVREYVEKVATPKGGDNGANAKSVVAGKNDMGGTTANIAKGGTEPENASTKGGLLNPSTKEDNAGNINVPGGKAGSAFTKKEPGHGAEKKGAGENADKSAGSLINGVKSRAK